MTNTRSIANRITTIPIHQSPSPIPSLKAPQADMVDPGVGSKAPDNWSTLLASVAAFLGALAAWFYRKAGQTPRPADNQKYDAEILRDALEPIREQLESLASSLRDTSTKVGRLDGRFDVFSLRLARVEGHQKDYGD